MSLPIGNDSTTMDLSSHRSSGHQVSGGDDSGGSGGVGAGSGGNGMMSPHGFFAGLAGHMESPHHHGHHHHGGILPLPRPLCSYAHSTLIAERQRVMALRWLFVDNKLR